jgi:hypothetical protein
LRKNNKLIDALNENDILLYDENYKFVNVEKDIALETKSNELLSKELSDSHSQIACLKSTNMN